MKGVHGVPTTITSVTRYDHTADTDIRGKLIFRRVRKIVRSDH